MKTARFVITKRAVFVFYMHLSLGLAGSEFVYAACDSILTAFPVLKRRTEFETLEESVKIGFLKPQTFADFMNRHIGFAQKPCGLVEAVLIHKI